MVGLLLVDGSGIDRLRQELVHAVGGHQGGALHPLAAKLETISYLNLETDTNIIGVFLRRH